MITVHLQQAWATFLDVACTASLIYGIIMLWCLWMQGKAGRDLKPAQILRIAAYCAIGLVHLIHH